MDYSDRYVFEAEWYDKVASLLKKFYLYYFPSDNTIELVCTQISTKVDIIANTT